MFALIEKDTNKILRISETGVELVESKPFYWIECPSDANNNWTFDGMNFIAPFTPEVVLPEVTIPVITVSPWQIRQALNELGLRSQVESLVKNTTNQDIKDGWEFATEWKETNQIVQTMGAQLGLTQSQIHAIFVLAKSKNV